MYPTILRTFRFTDIFWYNVESILHEVWIYAANAGPVHMLDPNGVVTALGISWHLVSYLWRCKLFLPNPINNIENTTQIWQIS